MYQISDVRLDSVKRVMSTDYYILNTRDYGLQLLTLNDLKARQFTLQNLLEVQDVGD